MGKYEFFCKAFKATKHPLNKAFGFLKCPMNYNKSILSIRCSPIFKGDIKS
jgi:hypothetical protein